MLCRNLSQSEMMPGASSLYGRCVEGRTRLEQGDGNGQLLMGPARRTPKEHYESLIVWRCWDVLTNLDVLGRRGITKAPPGASVGQCPLKESNLHIKEASSRPF